MSSGGICFYCRKRDCECENMETQHFITYQQQDEGLNFLTKPATWTTTFPVNKPFMFTSGLTNIFFVAVTIERKYNPETGRFSVELRSEVKRRDGVEVKEVSSKLKHHRKEVGERAINLIKGRTIFHKIIEGNVEFWQKELSK